MRVHTRTLHNNPMPACADMPQSPSSRIAPPDRPVRYGTETVAAPAIRAIIAAAIGRQVASLLRQPTP